MEMESTPVVGQREDALKRSDISAVMKLYKRVDAILMTHKMTLAKSLGSSVLARWAPIPLRLIVGFGFMQHGFAKISRGPDAFAAILHALGVPAPHFMAWVSILTELLGGLAVLVGAFVTLASVPMAILLLMAIFTVHLPNGFSSVKLIAVTAAGAQFGPPRPTSRGGTSRAPLWQEGCLPSMGSCLEPFIAESAPKSLSGSS